jgi:hypothetical protein
MLAIAFQQCRRVLPFSKNGDSAYLNRRSYLCGAFHDHPSNGLTYCWLDTNQTK